MTVIARLSAVSIQNFLTLSSHQWNQHLGNNIVRWTYGDFLKEEKERKSLYPYTYLPIRYSYCAAAHLMGKFN